MKNNLFKKVSAAALAGLMVLTFAPAASLTAFAGALSSHFTDGTADISINDSYTITSGGAWALTGSAMATNTITVAGVDVTLYMNGFNVGTIDVVSKGSVTLVDGTAATGVASASTVGAIKIGNGTTKDKSGKVIINGEHIGFDSISKGGDNEYSSLEIKKAGTITADRTDFDSAFGNNKIKLTIESGEYTKFNPATTYYTTREKTIAKDTIGSNPVAKVGDNYEVSNDSINAAEKKNGGNVVAYNGAVNVKALKKGNIAYVDVDTAREGTTLSATAADDTSLVTVKTTYNYTFELLNGDRGTTTYTDNVFGAGAEGLSKVKDTVTTSGYLGVTTPVARVNTNGIARGTYRNAANVVRPNGVLGGTYDRAVTLTENSKDEFEDGSAVLDYVDLMPEANYWKNGTAVGVPSGWMGISYFTADYSKKAPKNSGLAVIDGTKYIIDNSDGNTITNTITNSQLYAASFCAAKSIDVKTGSSMTTGKVANAFNTVHVNDGVKVSGPATETVVEYTYTSAGAKHPETTTTGYIFGEDQETSEAKGVLDSLTYTNTYTNYKLTVPQVAKDHVAAVVAFNDSDVEMGEGLTYFKNQKTSDLAEGKAHFYFGSVAGATEGLKSVLSGTTTSDKKISYYATAQVGDKVYAAKEIKGTFKGVNSGVEVSGEISADGSKQADGTMTWVINAGYAGDSVPAYRMYRKSGEHVYTINPDEVSMLVNAGWINEGTAFYVNPVTSKKGTAVYRVYNKNNGGMHFYTANAAEKDMLLANGWTEGAVVFYGADKATGIPVYRTYNTGSNNGEHNYTTNIAESDMNVKAGWRAEGVAFYVFK